VFHRLIYLFVERLQSFIHFFTVINNHILDGLYPLLIKGYVCFVCFVNVRFGFKSLRPWQKDTAPLGQQIGITITKTKTNIHPANRPDHREALKPKNYERS